MRVLLNAPVRPLSASLAVLVCFALALAALSAVFIILTRHVGESQEELAAFHFSEVVARTATAIRTDLQQELRLVQEAALHLSARWPLPEGELHTFLSSQRPLQKFKHAGLCLPDGSIVGDGKTARLTTRDEKLFARAWEGTPGIGATEADNQDGLPINTFAVPVLHQSRVVAVLFAALDSNLLSALMEVSFFDNRGGCLVMDGQGQGVSLGFDRNLRKNNLFEALEQDSVLNATAEQLRQHLNSGQAGAALFRHRNELYHVAFAPLGFNDWFCIGFLPQGVAAATMRSSLRYLTLALWVGGALFVALLCHAFVLLHTTRRQVQRQAFRMETLLGCVPGGALRCSDDTTCTILEYNQGFLDLLGYSPEEIDTRFHRQFQLMVYAPDRNVSGNRLDAAHSGRIKGDGARFTQEYRLECKDGSRVWITEFSQRVHDENGSHWCMVLLDTSARHNALERRLVEERRYRILFEMSEAILYEYDMRSGVLVTTRQFFDKFGYPLPDSLNTHHPVGMEIFHPEDMETFASLHQALVDGEAATEALIRIYRHDGQWLWCHVQQTALHDSHHNCIKALGKITDVDAETRVLYQLRDEVQRDPFTGLFNKIATAGLVDEALARMAAEPDKTGALCIVDLDNFKSINDRLGHETGDEVLKDFSSTLAGLFRSSDIVGRVGGDEFIVFVEDIMQLSVLVRKLDLVREAARRAMPCACGDVLHISASVGVALSPRDGTSFSVLYPRADKALYRSKEHKDVCSFYDPALDEG